MRLCDRICLLAALLVVTIRVGVIAGDDPMAATVRIVHGSEATAGTIVHSSPKFGTCILTCGHGHLSRQPWVASGRRSFRGTACVLSKSSDLAILWTSEAGSDCAPIAAQSPSSGAFLSVGHDLPLGSGRFAPYGGLTPRSWRAALLSGEESRDGHTGYAVRQAAGPGRSGGGLFSETNELVGVCSSRNGKYVLFVGLESVIDFLNRCHAQDRAPWWTPRPIPESTRDRNRREELADYFVWVGNLRLKTDDPQRALTNFDLAIESHPELAEAHFRRAQTLERLERFDDAWDAYQRAATLRVRPPLEAASSGAGVLRR